MQQSRCSVYIHCRASQKTQKDVIFEIFSRTKSISGSSKKITLPKGELISVLIHYRVEKNEELSVRIFGHDLDFEIEESSRVEGKNQN